MRRTAQMAAALLLALGCGDDGPPAEVEVVAANDMGTLETTNTVRGRDGGYSARVDGRSVWLYGDTILESAAENGSTWRHNSWSWTEDNAATDGITGFQEPVDAAGAPLEFFPQTDTERAFNDAHFLEPCTEEPCGARWALWPAAIVDDPDRNRALVFYSKIYAAPGDFNFHSVGFSIAVWNHGDPQPTRPVVSPDAEHPTLLFPASEPGFGGAALRIGDTLYAYSCETEGSGKPCRLGKVALADALSRSAWQFWTGDAWVDDIAQAGCVFSGNDILSVAWNPALDRYLALYSEPLGRRVMLRTAVTPEGPWSRPVHAFDAMAPDGDGWIYDALPHVEFERDEGLVQYVTYSRGSGFFQSEMRVVELELAAPR